MKKIVIYRIKKRRVEVMEYDGQSGSYWVNSVAAMKRIYQYDDVEFKRYYKKDYEFNGMEW